MATIQNKKFTRTKVASENARNRVELDNKKKDRVSRQASTQMIIDDRGCQSFQHDMSPIGTGTINPMTFGQAALQDHKLSGKLVNKRFAKNHGKLNGRLSHE